jgi:hypothetical protein
MRRQGQKNVFLLGEFSPKIGDKSTILSHLERSRIRLGTKFRSTPVMAAMTNHKEVTDGGRQNLPQGGVGRSTGVTTRKRRRTLQGMS